MVSPNDNMPKGSKLLHQDHHLIWCVNSRFRPTQRLEKVFEQLKDQQPAPMAFQLMRYLAKKGLDPIDEGEAQCLKQFIHDNQREESLM